MLLNFYNYQNYQGKKLSICNKIFWGRLNGWKFLQIHLDPDFFTINKNSNFQSPLKNKREETFTSDPRASFLVTLV